MKSQFATRQFFWIEKLPVEKGEKSRGKKSRFWPNLPIFGYIIGNYWKTTFCISLKLAFKILQPYLHKISQTIYILNEYFIFFPFILKCWYFFAPIACHSPIHLKIKQSKNKSFQAFWDQFRIQLINFPYD